MNRTDESIEAYNQTAEVYAKSVQGKADKAELARFAGHLRSGAKVLDVGCAAGRDTRILKDEGFDVVGVDLAEKLLEIAKKSHPDITFLQADIRQLPFEAAAFDGVWASAVLHHVKKSEMPGVLAEFWRVLAPGGILYLHTKVGQGTLTTNEELVQNQKRQFTLVTSDELDAMLTDAHFRKIELQVAASKSRPGLFWANALYSKGGSYGGEA